MAHLTWQEVIDRVNNFPYPKNRRRAGYRFEPRPHDPEVYVPRVTKFFAGLLLGAFRPSAPATAVRRENHPQSVSSQVSVP